MSPNRLREPSGCLDLVVGFGPTHLPMEWLYALSVSTREGWSREWLLSQVQTMVPTTRGKRVAWSLSSSQQYFWDVSQIAGHEITVKLTDPLVRHTLHDQAVTNIQRLFLAVQREVAYANLPASGLSTPSQIAHKYLGAALPASPNDADQTVRIELEAFPNVEGSLRMASAG